jgi:CheY-like chemotaxis protein
MNTILIIEDNLELLENLVEYFGLEGYKTLTANNGKVGVEVAKKSISDLIICDILMKEMNGHDVLRLLLESSITNDIPFIFSTCYAEREYRRTSLDLGADDYIIKPFELEKLLLISENWIKWGSNRYTESRQII